METSEENVRLGRLDTFLTFEDAQEVNFDDTKKDYEHVKQNQQQDVITKKEIFQNEKGKKILIAKHVDSEARGLFNYRHQRNIVDSSSDDGWVSPYSSPF